MSARKPDVGRASRLAQRAMVAAGASGAGLFATGPVVLAAAILGAFAKSDEEAEAALVRFIKAEKP